MNTDNACPDTAPAPAGTPDDPIKPPVKRRFAGGINHYPPRRSKLNDLLSDEHRDEYEALVMRDTSIPKLRAWLEQRGYHVGRCTVERHRMKRLSFFDHVKLGSAVAEQFALVARAAGLSLREASIGGMHQMLMQFFTRQQKNNTLTATDVRALAAGVEDFVDTCQKVERVRQELAESGTADPQDQAAVVERVREILGV